MSILENANSKFGKNEELLLTKSQFAELVEEIRNNIFKFVPPGHFYSPLPDLDDIAAQRGMIWRDKESLPAIDMNKEGQHEILDAFFDLAANIPFEDNKKPGLRYYYINDAYSYADAITLHGMIRHFKPRRIIEVGSGHSSCVMLDTNELFFNNSIDLTFIEPYPSYFLSLITEEDKKRNKIIGQKIQDVPLTTFDTLESGDILFIDSSHVSKVNSDVNHILFEILPRLAKGVLVHFHDIFFPFEYPYEWIAEGRAWNEAYLLRAFLEYNNTFKVLFMSTYAARTFTAEIEKGLPLFMKNMGGDIWLRKN